MVHQNYLDKDDGLTVKLGRAGVTGHVADKGRAENKHIERERDKGKDREREKDRDRDRDKGATREKGSKSTKKVESRAVPSPVKRLSAAPRRESAASLLQDPEVVARPKRLAPKDRVQSAPARRVVPGRSIKSAQKPRALGAIVDKGPTFHRHAGGELNSYYLGRRRVDVHVPEAYAAAPIFNQPPSRKLTLEYIYGYNGCRARHNVRYTARDELCYSVAACGVVFNPDEKTQRFFMGHDDDVTAFAMNHDRTIAATGQRDPIGKAAPPYVCVWDVQSMQELGRIHIGERFVSAIAFGGFNSKYLLTVGGDDNHTLSIWDWRRRPDKPLLEYSTSKAEICNIECCPREMPGTLLRFATVGEKHLKLHKITVDSRGDLSFQARIPSGFSKTNIAQKCYTDACYLDNGTIAIATVSGHIYIYDGESYDLLKFYKAHAGPVGALTALDKGFASGGSDGFLRAWTNSGKPMQEEIELDMRGSKKVVVRSLDALNGRLIVGTKNCEIFETSFDDGLTKMVMCGNSDDVWALATHPTKPVMAVGGDDMVVRLWDFKAKKVLLKVRCKAAVKECCFDREGKRLALGLADGGVCMLDIASAKMIFEDKVCAEQVSAMMFHPNGKQLAVGSWDQSLYLISNDSSVKKLKGHTSSVIHLMYSTDGAYIMTDSKDYEVLYWSSQKGSRTPTVPASTSWLQWGCVLGWPIQGIWKKGFDGTDINAVAISGGPVDGSRLHASDASRIVATCDDQGGVSIYQYPCLAPHAEHHTYKGHSSHVTNVQFSHDDRYLLSTGGFDLCVFQWRVQKSESQAARKGDDRGNLW